MLPLGALPATKPLIPFYSAVSMQPTEVPRWSTLLTPCFKTQPLSVLVYFHLRKGTQSWFPRRLWGGWCLGHWGPCRLEGQVCQLWWLPLPVPLETDGGKGVAIVLHSESTPCFYGVPGFFHKLFYLWSSLLQFHQEQFHQGTAVPYLDRCSQPHFSATSPPPQQEIGWDVQGCSTDNVFNFYFVLPAKDHQLYYLLLSWKSFFCPS